jgi:hypothetical protein
MCFLKMDKKFKVDQLRKDKIIYATEAIATDLACLLVIILSEVFFTGFLRNIFLIGSVITGAGYTLYMGVGNYFRLKKIIELEKDL